MTLPMRLKSEDLMWLLITKVNLSILMKINFKIEN